MIQGSLTEANVSDLVVQIYTIRKSGILRLSQSEIKKSLYFKDGSIVFAHSNLRHERLGEILLRLGKITPEEFQTVSGKLQSGMRLGQALYEQGFLSPSEVTAGVSYQIQIIVYSVFNWDQGEYEFLEREKPVYEDIMVETSTPQLIIDGIRNITNLRVLERGVQSVEDQVVLVNTGSKRLHRSNLDFSEETILACINGKATVAQLRTISRLNAFEFGRALYCLSLSGMIRFGNNGGSSGSALPELQKKPENVPLHTQPMPAEAPSANSRRMKTYSEPELRRLIADTEKKFEDASDEEVLNVFPDALPEEIQEAYDRLSAIFHPPYYAADRYNDIKGSLKRIVDRLLSAHHELLERASMQQPLLEEDLDRPVIVTPETPTTASQPAPVPEEAVQPQELSVDALQHALSWQPLNATLMRELGLKLQRAGRPRDGEKHLQRALEIEPHNMESHFALAEFYQLQGLKFKAFKHLNIILQLDPTNQRAMDLLGIKKRKGGLYEISH